MITATERELARLLQAYHMACDPTNKTCEDEQCRIHYPIAHKILDKLLEGNYDNR